MDPDAVDEVTRVPHGGSDDPEVIDFSANTNPVRPGGVADAYEAALADATSYDDDFPAFRAAAADYVDCDPEAVVPTAGGVAALRLAFGVTVSPGDRVALPEPGFGEYAREVGLQGGEPVGLREDELLDVDPAAYDVVAVCTPNNPTGYLPDPAALQSLLADCRTAGTPLVVDEAFLDFTHAPSLAGEPGVIVARSLTKMFGLPGIRAGFAVATGGLGDRLRTARPTWSLSVPAAAVGTHCLRAEAFVERTRDRVEAERARMREALSDAYDVAPSDAPFLLVDVGDGPIRGDESTSAGEPSGGDESTSADAVDAVLARTRDAGVAVRDARTFAGLDSHIRVAVRRPHENDLLLDALLDR
ncbi:aminotransferase class I/II-fold pyridoxal phosphate-dependent enzyme [Halobellus ruber]|uniref:Aminotransferase n=1 Tax=Halobellus ruber TaxID=2761102 RepID=A0A7J9SKR6_9EURY|nr:aminotransferase class I/II-fold pyridoxal phosphate-dependent enzyme [Halobellus ruber]MBB6647554.1 pyridoxal phosphate-dependent class II aminotransferase [Halobellus ruber]